MRDDEDRLDARASQRQEAGVERQCEVFQALHGVALSDARVVAVNHHSCDWTVAVLKHKVVRESIA